MDDHALVRAGLRLLLEGAGMEVVGEAGSRREALQVIGSVRCDLVLVDLKLGGDDGMACVSAVHLSHPDVSVVVLTMSEDDSRVVEALRVGASGYVVKAAPPAELLAALRHVALGGSYIDPRVARALVAEVRQTDRSLSDVERSVLQHLAAGSSNQEISQRLSVSLATVKRHLSALYSRFEVKSRSGLVAEAMNRGLITGRSD